MVRIYGHFAAAYGTLWFVCTCAAVVSLSHIDTGAFGLIGFPVIAALYALCRVSNFLAPPVAHRGARVARLYGHFAAAHGTLWLVVLSAAVVSQIHIDTGLVGFIGFPAIAVLYALCRIGLANDHTTEIAHGGVVHDRGGWAMRLPRIHFTVRRLMVVVALVAASAWGLHTGWRWLVYRRQAVYHANRGQLLLFSVTAAEANAARARRQLPETLNCAGVASQIFLGDREVTFEEFAAHHEQLVAEMDAEVARARARVTYHTQLERKYVRAAARPWRPVAPDPSPP